MKIPKVFLYAGVGAALMYLFDPENGTRRRALLRDQAVSKLDEAEGLLESRSDDLSNRAKGLVHETRKILAAETERVSRVAEAVAEDVGKVKQEINNPTPTNKEKLSQAASATKKSTSTSTRSRSTKASS